MNKELSFFFETQGRKFLAHFEVIFNEFSYKLRFGGNDFIEKNGNCYFHYVRKPHPRCSHERWRCADRVSPPLRLVLQSC
jgi:hypothetical protein